LAIVCKYYRKFNGYLHIIHKFQQTYLRQSGLFADTPVCSKKFDIERC
jgi:hypothetical protein